MQRTNESRGSAGASAVAVAAVLVVGAAVTAMSVHVPPSWSAITFVAFALLIGASALTEVDLATDKPYPLGLAPALAYALFGGHALPETIAVFACGSILAVLVHGLRRSELRVFDYAAQILSLAVAVGVLRGVAALVPEPAFRTPDAVAVIPVVGVLAMLIVLAMTETMLHVERDVTREGMPLLAAMRDRLRATGAVHVSQVSVAALLALAYPSLGAWAFPLFLAPLAATRYAFRQFASIRTTYLQTIRALSKVPEMAGYTADGHSARVARNAVAIARELGIPAAHVKEIEYAALLHDIGRVSLSEPEPAEAGDRARLAEIGGQIVRETRHFPRVAEMIEHQHEDAARSVGPVGSLIIRACSDYDDLGAAHGDAIALERVSAGVGLHYDAAVVHALETVIARSAVAGAA